MKIVFMGTPEFAVESLDILMRNHFDIVGVITAPDKPAGRGQQLQQSAVKKYAIQKNLRVLQPEKLKDEKFISELMSLNADLQFVVAFRMLPEIVWNMPALGTYNLHASLLPKYRGAAPINWAIIKGEKETGVTTFKLQHEIDTGNILFQQKVAIGENENAGELHDKLKTVGAELILKTARAIEASVRSGEPLHFTSQDSELASHAPKIFRETCKISFNDQLEQIHDLVRGLSPYPGAWCEIAEPGKSPLTLRVLKTEKENSAGDLSNGSLVTDNKSFLKVSCSGGFLLIKELQLQGKKTMGVKEFLNGFKIKEGSVFL